MSKPHHFQCPKCQHCSDLLLDGVEESPRKIFCPFCNAATLVAYYKGKFGVYPLSNEFTNLEARTIWPVDWLMKKSLLFWYFKSVYDNLVIIDRLKSQVRVRKVCSQDRCGHRFNQVLKDLPLVIPNQEHRILTCPKCGQETILILNSDCGNKSLGQRDIKGIELPRCLKNRMSAEEWQGTRVLNMLFHTGGISELPDVQSVTKSVAKPQPIISLVIKLRCTDCQTDHYPSFEDLGHIVSYDDDVIRLFICPECGEFALAVQVKNISQHVQSRDPDIETKEIDLSFWNQMPNHTRCHYINELFNLGISEIPGASDMEAEKQSRQEELDRRELDLLTSKAPTAKDLGL